LSDITPSQLNISSSFTLVSTANRRTKLSAFILYFDAFFTVNGQPVSPDTKVHVIKKDDFALAEVWPVGGKLPHRRKSSQSQRMDKVTSFSTGPKSVPTHWKQTLFLLREPVFVEEGGL
jgi:type I protein arginine methyltransferase